MLNILIIGHDKFYKKIIGHLEILEDNSWRINKSDSLTDALDLSDKLAYDIILIQANKINRKEPYDIGISLRQEQPDLDKRIHIIDFDDKTYRTLEQNSIFYHGIPNLENFKKFYDENIQAFKMP
jgi:two-component SAPR family response regulator